MSWARFCCRTHRASPIGTLVRACSTRLKNCFWKSPHVAEGVDADRHRLRLAEVYYWRGKPHDGRAVIDTVLDGKGRDPFLLIDASALLRRVGSVGEARSFSEEAYRSGGSALIRSAAAVQRSLMGLDSDDKILWLGRGDPNDSEVKVLLREEEGHRAFNSGDLSQAIALFREAVSLYDAMPKGRRHSITRP